MKLKLCSFFSLLLSFMFAVLMLPACQPTPDEPIVNSGGLDDIIEATAIPTADGSLASVYGFPKSHSDSFECLDTSVSFNVNARVVVPSVKAAPVVKVEPIALTADFIRSFAEKIQPGIQWYQCREIWTKSKIEEKILKYQEELSRPYEEFAQDYAKSSGISDPSAAKEYYKQCVYVLDRYKELYKDAPDDAVSNIPADFEFHPFYGYYFFVFPELEYGDITEGIDPNDIGIGPIMNVTCAAGSGYTASLYARASRDDDEPQSELIYSCAYTHKDDNILVKPYFTGKELKALKLNDAELKALGDSAVAALGLSDCMTLTEFSRANFSCTMTYQRMYGGIPGVIYNVSQNEYAYNPEAESIKVTVQNDIISRIVYTSPFRVDSVENDNIALLSFDEAYAAFKKQAAVEYVSGNFSCDRYLEFDNDREYKEARESAGSFKNVTFNVKSIELAMARIPISGGGFRCVPAWVFRGTENLIYTGANFYDDEVHTLMIINAADGSRISGYVYNLDSGS